MKAVLSEKEKRILTQVVAHPDWTDRQVSDATGINRNTAAFLRNRLVKDKMIVPRYLPDPRAIKAELMVVIYTEFNPAISDEERIAKTGTAVDAYDEIFYSLGEGRHGFSISLSENYTEISKINERRIATYAENDFLESKHPVMVILPLERTVVWSFFDFAPLLTYKFMPEGEYTEIREKIDPYTEEPKLSPNEADVLVRLMEADVPHDEALAHELGVSRKTIHNIKKRLLDKGIIKKVYMPDLARLGFSLMHLCHVKLNPRYELDMDDLGAMAPPSAIFAAVGKYDVVFISPFWDYSDYNNFYNRYTQDLKLRGIIKEDPVNRIFTFDDMKMIKFLEFRPLVEKMLM